MGAFTDAERIEDLLTRRRITGRRKLAEYLEGDSRMAAVFWDDPDGSKMRLAERLMAENRRIADARNRAWQQEEAARRRAERECSSYDDIDWADLGIPVDEQGCPLGIGDD